MKRTILFFLIATFSCSLVSAQLKILSGIDKGTYNQMAKDMMNVCGDKIVYDTVKEKLPIYNDKQQEVGQKDTMYVRSDKETFLSIKTSGGSVDNYRQLVTNRSSGVDVTFMQYDVLLLEELKKMKRGEKKEDNVRILFPLGTEEIHLITRADNFDIRRMKDLRNLRVGIGTKQSGTQVTALFIKEITGIQWFNLEWDLEQSFKALFNGQLDAFFFVGSAPIKRLTDMSSLLKYEIKLIPIDDENLLAYYPKAVIKSGTYPWSKEDINTFAVKDAIVTNIDGETDAKRADLRKFLTDVKDNLPKLQKDGHPEWQEVDFNFDGIDWKIHDVAKEVFKLQ